MKANNTYFHSNGKLLISGEYLVLEGATALALPINKGQSLTIKSNENHGILNWIAKHKNGNWFQTKINTSNFEILFTDNQILSKHLVKILRITKQLNSEFLNPQNGFSVTTNLEFLPQHGFGSSSTLINNIANWAKGDAFKLQELTFKGSGYDIACAMKNNAIFFKLENNKPIVENANFNPLFSENLYFVYLGKKQKSLESIKSFRQNAKFSFHDINEISNISKLMVETNNLKDFENLIETHEKIISRVIGRQKIKDLLFKDFHGSVKSLGGWGGDFVLMSTEMEKADFKNYLKKNNFETFYNFSDLLIKEY